MKVTGYLIRERLRQCELRKKFLYDQFEGSLLKFPDEVKPSPMTLHEQILAVEEQIVKLQDLQMRFNLAVQVKLEDGRTMTLLEAVKRVGSAGRLEKTWRKTATPEKNDRYGYTTDRQRDPDMVYAVRQVSLADALGKAELLMKAAGDLRAAIAVGNAKRSSWTCRRTCSADTSWEGGASTKQNVGSRGPTHAGSCFQALPHVVIRTVPALRAQPR